MYRITVRADGFVPQLWVGEQNNGGLPLLTGVYVLNPIHIRSPNPSAASGTRHEAQVMYVAPATKDFPISIDYGSDTKIHTVNLQANRTYQIDMLTTEFDSQVMLEHGEGKLLQRGFAVEGSNSRLVFRPARTGTYRIVAGAQDDNATGAYTVVVSESLMGPGHNCAPDAPHEERAITLDVEGRGSLGLLCLQEVNAERL